MGPGPTITAEGVGNAKGQLDAANSSGFDSKTMVGRFAANCHLRQEGSDCAPEGTTVANDSLR